MGCAGICGQGGKMWMLTSGEEEDVAWVVVLWVFEVLL